MDLASIETVVTPLLSQLDRKENLQRLREALRDPDPREWDRPWVVNRWTPERVPGIEALWDKVAVAVAPLLQSSDWLVQSAALLMLQYTPSASIAAAVLPLTQHSELQVALLAVHLIGELGPKVALPAEVASSLVALTHSPIDLIRQAAAAALGKVGGVEQLDVLRRLMLIDPAPGVRNWAARSLGEAGGDAALADLLARVDVPDIHPGVGPGVAAGLNAIGAAAVGPLIERTESADVGVRARALEAIAKSPDPRVELILRQALSSGIVEVEVAAGFALALRKNVRGKGKLVEIMARGKPLDKLAAAGRLASLGERAGFTELVAAYFDPNLGRAAKAQLAVVADGARPGVLEVIKIVGTPPILRAVLDLAGAYGLVQASPLLIEHLKHPNPIIQFTAALSLVRIAGAPALPPIADQLRGLSKPLERLALIATTDDLWHPLPAALGEQLLKDQCALITVFGAHILANQAGQAGAERVVAFLHEAWAARDQRKGRYPGQQNDQVLGDATLRQIIIGLEAPLQIELEPAWSVGDAGREQSWRDAWAVACGGAMATLATSKPASAAAAVEPFLGADVAFLRYRAAQTLLVLGAPNARQQVARLVDDPDPLVSALGNRLK